MATTEDTENSPLYLCALCGKKNIGTEKQPFFQVQESSIVNNMLTIGNQWIFSCCRCIINRWEKIFLSFTGVLFTLFPRRNLIYENPGQKK